VKGKELGVQIKRSLEQGTKPSRMLAGRPRWLIVRERGNMLDPMCVYVGVERVLPVFSFEEEAKLFLQLGSYEAHWRARKSCVVDLVWVLRGPCADVKSVALDPLPEMLEDGTLALVGVKRKRFLEYILARQKHG
jgi:hypothetical protein